MMKYTIIYSPAARDDLIFYGGRDIENMLANETDLP